MKEQVELQHSSKQLDRKRLSLVKNKNVPVLLQIAAEASPNGKASEALENIH